MDGRPLSHFSAPPSIKTLPILPPSASSPANSALLLMFSRISDRPFRKTRLLCALLSQRSPTRSYASLEFNPLFVNCSSLRDVKRIHALILTTGSSHSLALSTKLVNLARVLSAPMDYAYKVFDQMTERDVVLWNAVIHGYSDLGPCQKALTLYQKMHQHGILPDCYTFPFVLRSCAVLSAICVGKQAHCNVIKNGFDSVGFVQNSLLTMYSQSGEVLSMESVFQEIPVRNVVSWSAMIAGYVQNGMFKEGLVVLRDMLTAGTRPNGVTFVSVLPACASLKLLILGKLIHSYVLKMGMDFQLSVANALIAFYGKSGNLDAAKLLFDHMQVRDVVSWNTMVASYEQNNACGEAIRLFLKMQDEGVGYNYITTVSVISACTTLGDLDSGRRVHEMANSKGFSSNASVQNALVDMYSKCGDMDSARRVFETLHHRSVLSWSTLIAGCAHHGQANLAIELFSRMKKEGVRPNGFTFLAVLSACRHAGLVEEGKRQFESMARDYSMAPRLEHCNCLVDLLGRAGCLKEAYDFIQRMPMKPDAGVWGALLSACRVHGDVELAEVVAEEVFRLKPQTVSFYVLMSQIYAESGRWEDALRLRNLFHEKNLEKLPGHSFIAPLTDSC